MAYCVNCLYLALERPTVYAERTVFDPWCRRERLFSVDRGEELVEDDRIGQAFGSINRSYLIFALSLFY